MIALRAALVFVAMTLVGAVGCDDRPAPRSRSHRAYEDPEQRAHVEELAPSDPTAPPPPAIADTSVAPAVVDPRDRPPTPVLAATHADDAWADTEPVRARRYVYRVRMAVPSGLGTGGDSITLPAAELFIDVTRERLRARFTGVGWPVPAGSEVRLRSDRPGVYLFDGEGGRPLAPGRLSEWFEGGEVNRRGPPLRVIARYGIARNEPLDDEEDAPGELICALLAEWAPEDREAVLRRCEQGAPRLFRLGFWRAEQTAGVPVMLPRSSLRADEHGRPAPIVAERSRAFLEPEALGRIRPEGPPDPQPAADAPPEGLRVRNDSATRVVITVEGVALGWVDGGADAWFVGLAPGAYEVGAVRPMGAVVQRSRLISIPGTHRVCEGRCPRAPASEAPAEPAPVGATPEPPAPEGSRAEPGSDGADAGA